MKKTSRTLVFLDGHGSYCTENIKLNHDYHFLCKNDQSISSTQFGKFIINSLMSGDSYLDQNQEYLNKGECLWFKQEVLSARNKQEFLVSYFMVEEASINLNREFLKNGNLYFEHILGPLKLEQFLDPTYTIKNIFEMYDINKYKVKVIDGNVGIKNEIYWLNIQYTE